jgi:chemotaxis protein histidine kinase CheA
MTSAKPDHEVIVPPSNLKAYALHIPDGGEAIDLDALERAEKALAALSSEFNDWMRSEVDTLTAARAALPESGQIGIEQMDALYRAAHDIRGQAATFGFPLAGDIADNLCDYLDALPNPLEASLEFVDAHVNAIAAILREDVRDRADPTARAVLFSLNEARKRFSPGLEPVIREIDGEHA